MNKAKNSIPNQNTIISPNDITALKHLGQNFLTNSKISSRFINECDLTSATNAVEIGPGKGALTFQIASKVNKLVCIEKDPRLALFVSQKAEEQGIDNIQIINQDVLEIEPSSLPKNYKLIGSLPFNISKQIIKKFFEIDNSPENMFLILQKEVAEDYSAKPPNATFLSNYVQIYGSCKYLFTIKKGNFRPVPKVDAAAVKIFHEKQPQSNSIGKKDPLITNKARFGRFIKTIFHKPRKILKNNLKTLTLSNKDRFLEDASEIVNTQKRPQEIEFDQIKKLFILYNKYQQ
jgi:16S rRNA (adenine1518-N6/adenine1519-N6)-dimethyltransferase